MGITRCPETFTQLYTSYSKAIRTKITDYLKDKAAAEDVFQDIFCKVWKKMPSYDPDRGSIYSWLMTITKSCCIDYLRKSNKKSFDDIEQEIVWSVEDNRLHPDIRLLRHELHRLSSFLSPELRQVIVTVYYNGYTQEEAATILQIPLGTVKSRQRRALQLLRKIYCNKE